MKYKIFLFIFLSCRIVTAQVSYKGIVKDAVNDEPVSTVNVMVLNKNAVVQTNSKGYFEITCSPEDSVQFSHLIYNTVKLKGKELTGVVLMLEKTFELTGVIISAETTENLMRKAINKLYNNMEINANIPYTLFHEDKADGNTVRTCNANMLLVINGQNKDKTLKNKWYIAKMISKQMDSLFCVLYSWTKNNLNLATDPGVNFFLKNYRKIDKTLLYEKETDNDSLIVIRSFPKKKTKPGHLITRFYIDKKDTVFYKRVTENNAPFKNEKIYYKGKIYENRIIQFRGLEEYKKGKSGYYFDSSFFCIKREFSDCNFSHYHQLVTLKSCEPEPYKEEKIPKTKQHRVRYSSYLYDNE
ncbi:MAG: carboxypeptidase-like regulatory domain-containing protein [Bacteroidales bacterium]|jgi:uncharacterized protein YcfL|nr:carboxypeptidase-like regulatory domain-containing protein [Bacteroidales bacterium]